ncbi:MAG: glycosyltransferase family 4 protein [Deltaproteobacteria bacterium]|nr:glycosyltransferase family 4 protein [Deltaproteobacteria bacterium]
MVKALEPTGQSVVPARRRERTLTVLAVHNRYLWRGGEDQCFDSDVALLRAHGHTVDEYLEDNERVARLGHLRTALRSLWSLETFRKVRARLRARRYDLVSVHNTFPLISPSVYYAAQQAGVPVVQTLHNFRLVCLNALLFRGGRVCEDCVGKALPWPGILHGCYHGRLGSASLALMLLLHRMLGTWDRQIDLHVSLGKYTLARLAEAGVATRPLHRPDFLTSDPGLGTGDGDYGVFAGRLSAEKGVLTVVEAWQRLGARAPRLKLIGDGPLRDCVAQAAASVPALECLGLITNEEVKAHLKRARFLVFPSLCYETCPRIVMEALGSGVPVVAAKVGAAGFMIEHGVTGLHFRSGDSADLAQQIEWLVANPDALAAMRPAARREYLASYSPEQSYSTFQEIVRRAHARHGKPDPWSADDGGDRPPRGS